MEEKNYFLSGLPATLSESDSFIRHLDSQKRYTDVLKYVKANLTSKLIEVKDNSICIDWKGKDDSLATKVVMTRFLNIVHKGKYDIKIKLNHHTEVMFTKHQFQNASVTL